MKRRKSLGAFALLLVTALLMTACGGSNPGYILPTFAPRVTLAPDSGNVGPTPTTAPDVNYTRIISLNGEDFNQTSNFSTRGIANIAVKPIAYTGSYSFYVSGREDASGCVYLNFADASGNMVPVAGKVVHVAAWVYHETGVPADFACRITGKKPDGTSDSPESVNINQVPSGQWTLIEGDLPIYTNLSNPNISIEMSSSKDPYYFDDIRVTYDETSTVGMNSSYGVGNFGGIFADFDDQSNPFAGRGSGVPTIINGGYDGSSHCLKITGRTADWNGVEINLSEYGLSGSDLWVSFAAKHDAKVKSRVTCSLQWVTEDSTSEKYANITTTDSVLPGKWTTAVGNTVIPANAKTVFVYFEGEGTHDLYLDDIIIADRDPATIEEGSQGGNQGTIDTPELSDVDLSKFVTIHSLRAENSDETMILLPRNAELNIIRGGYSGSCFKVSGRTQAWNGISVDFTTLDDKTYDVIGKQIYISCWVYQNSGAPLEFSATLQANKPDGTQVWPERVSTEALPSGVWTHIEGVIPVYANVKVPQINFELPGSDTQDFLVDEIKISYDPNSEVPLNPDYEEAEKVPFQTINLTFEDNEAFFQSRGTGRPSIVYGGHNSNKCLAVVERSANWNGVQADLSGYDLAGKTLDITYWVYHEYTTPLQVKMTAEQNDGENTTYIPVIADGEMEDGKWIKCTNTYTVPENIKKFILYFESPVETAEFFIDDVTIKLQ